MGSFRTGFADEVAQAVAEVEFRTAAELVVVLADRAEGYRDLAYAAAAGASFGALVVAIYSPWHFPEALVVGGLPLFFLAAAALGLAWPRLLLALANPARIEGAMDRLAKLAFVDEAVTGTKDRTGILVLASRLEDRLRIVADAGVLARLPAAAFNEAAHRFPRGDRAFEDRVLATLRALAEPLAKALPKASDDTDELANAPRLRTHA